MARFQKQDKVQEQHGDRNGTILKVKSDTGVRKRNRYKVEYEDGSKEDVRGDEITASPCERHNRKKSYDKEQKEWFCHSCRMEEETEKYEEGEYITVDTDKMRYNFHDEIRDGVGDKIARVESVGDDYLKIRVNWKEEDLTREGIEYFTKKGTIWVDEDVASKDKICTNCATRRIWHDKRQERFCPFCNND